MNYAIESAQWKDAVVRWCGEGARLLHVSSSSSDIRLYACGSRIFKIRRLTPASVHGRPNSLEDEHLMLERLATKPPRGIAVPKALSYRSESGWECLELTALDAPVMTDPVANPRRESMSSLYKLAVAAWRLGRVGISHGDLEPDNVGLNAHGFMVLLDFDQATFAHPVRCVLRDFAGIPAGGRAARCTLLDRVGRHPWIAPGFRLGRMLRRLAGGGRNPDDGPWSALLRARARENPTLIALAEAWSAAARSGANSPGRRVAYYSLDVDGVHFPGERPWIMRWHPIDGAVNFRGKRLVELGCNMGLLSIHARLAGASEAVGADASEGIVAAARSAAAAFGVTARFLQADFDADSDWETRVGEGDIVSALSLTYWLRDKDRLWRYLARFDEILFEGHEAEEETRARFRGLGYGQVIDLGFSERCRKLFLARRESPAEAR